MNTTEASIYAAGIVAASLGAAAWIRREKKETPDPTQRPIPDWLKGNIDLTENPLYHLVRKQNFQGGQFYDDCPGAMVGWSLWGIHSAALRKMPVAVGHVIRVYRVENNFRIINKHAVVTRLGGLRTTEVNLLLWGGDDGEIKPNNRMDYPTSSHTNPQTHYDGRIFHVNIEHVGFIRNIDNIQIQRYNRDDYKP